MVAGDEPLRDRLQAIHDGFASRGDDLALFLVFDRPERAGERPGLARAFFAQRCALDVELNQMIKAFRAVGAYVELFEGEQPMMRALADGRIESMSRPLKVVYNGIEGGIAWDGFAPGRKALIPCVVDSYGLICTNSNAYACALGRHKFHYFTVMRALGIRAPATWHYRSGRGWAGGQGPPLGTKVIVKSTYESWSVGVTDQSIFVVDDECDVRVAAIADQLGQPATVQEFISGAEVCVPVFADPAPFATPPMETILTKAPGDLDAFTTIHDNLQAQAIMHRRYGGPSGVLAELTTMALQVFDVLELQAFARIDFRVDREGRVWVTDVGVSPGISEEDSAFHSLVELEFDHPSFLRVVVGATLASRAATH